MRSRREQVNLCGQIGSLVSFKLNIYRDTFERRGWMSPKKGTASKEGGFGGNLTYLGQIF